MPQDDSVPAGITLDAPSAPAAAPAAAPASDLPAGLTEDTPGPNAPGAGVLQNPGGDLPTARTDGGPPTNANVIETKTIPHSVSDFVLNQFPTSAGNFIANTWGAIRHPLDTVSGLAKLASGGVQAAARAAGIDLPENEYDDVAHAFGHYIANRYGSVDKAKEALYHDPVGVMSDFSVVAGGVGGIADLANLAKTGEVLGTISKVANPMFLPGKIAKGVVSLATPAEKAVEYDPFGKQPEFDPKTGEVYPGKGEARTAAQDAIKAQKAQKAQAAQQAQQAAQEQAAQAQQTAQQAAQEQAAQAQAAAQKAAAQQARQAAVKDRAYALAEKQTGQQGAIPGRAHWLQAEQDVPPVKEPPPPKPPKAAPQPKAAKPPKPQAPPPAAAPPPAPPPTATNPIWDLVKRNTVPALTGVGLGWAAEHFTHAITGSIVAGTLAGGAVKLIPKFLGSPAGQQMLARIGPGSSAANAAAVAHDMIPALNAMYKSTHPEQQLDTSQIDLSQSPYFHAKGGAVNHELARIQRERLPLRSATIRSLYGG